MSRSGTFELPKGTVVRLNLSNLARRGGESTQSPERRSRLCVFSSRVMGYLRTVVSTNPKTETGTTPSPQLLYRASSAAIYSFTLHIQICGAIDAIHSARPAYRLTCLVILQLPRPPLALLACTFGRSLALVLVSTCTLRQHVGCVRRSNILSDSCKFTSYTYLKSRLAIAGQTGNPYPSKRGAVYFRPTQTQTLANKLYRNLQWSMYDFFSPGDPISEPKNQSFVKRQVKSIENLSQKVTLSPTPPLLRTENFQPHEAMSS